MSYWDQQAASGDLRAVIDSNDHLGHKNAWIDCLTKTALASNGRFSSKDTVLDFGCGIGRIALWLARRTNRVVGVDMSAKMLEKARESATARGLKNVSFLPFDGVALAPAGVFDKVTCVYVLECIVDDAAFGSALSVLAGAVKSGGTVLLIERTSEDNPHEPWMPPGTILRRPLAEYHAAIRRAGLTPVASLPVRDPGLVCSSWKVNTFVLGGRAPSWLLPWIAKWHMAVKKRETGKKEWVDYLFVCRKD